MSTPNAPIIYRQGDVALVRVEVIPDNTYPVPCDVKRGIVLAEGEATGHAHRIASPLARNASLYRTEADQRYLRVSAAGAQLFHEEHKTRCHACPELPLVLATHYMVGADAEEHTRYTCDDHRGPRTIQLEAPGNTYLPSGDYHRTLDADYVPGSFPRDVAD